MEEKEDQVKLSKRFRVFQLYSVQIAFGCITAFYVLSLETVKNVFILADAISLYAIFFAWIIIIGVVACVFSGGIGLLRLINYRKFIRLIEKEDSDDRV